MSSGGYVKLYRELLDKAIWKCATANQKIVLITVLLMANHKEQQWEWDGKQYTCQPGEFICSERSLADKAGVSRQVVRDSLERFQKLGFSTHQRTQEGTQVKINNWADYQGALPHEGTQERTHKETTETPQGAHNKNNKKKRIYSSSDFETAEWIFSKILEMNPKNRRPNMENWAESIRMMREQDCRTDSEIRELFQWANQDTFWRDKILSPEKLRKQFDQLTIKRTNNRRNHSANSAYGGETIIV